VSVRGENLLKSVCDQWRRCVTELRLTMRPPLWRESTSSVVSRKWPKKFTCVVARVVRAQGAVLFPL
jgi:hypothetical protein